MAKLICSSSCFFFFFLLLRAAAANGVSFERADFPDHFVFGAGTSAYQYEGGADEDGRSPSVWDTFTHAGGMPDRSTGDVSSDGYHKYEDDLELMSDMGLEAYRFSISWSRLIPNGRGALNPKGVEYYNSVIDGLVKRGIQIHILLHHLDLPQVLEDEYGGWLSPRIVDDFVAYADACFGEFGDRVTHWTTMDEPNVMAIAAYDSGALPPNHCSRPFGIFDCRVGNSTVEPYIAAHNSILAHAAAVTLYRRKYQVQQKGVIGMNIYTFWCYPYSDSTSDLEATRRTREFMFHWILDPLVFGDYPEVMKKVVGDRIPAFTDDEKQLVRGAIDFIAINHYTSVYVSVRPEERGLRDYSADIAANFRASRDDPPAGQFTPTNLTSDPEGLRFMLNHLKERYTGLPLYIQENGYGQATKDSMHDIERVEYVSGYMEATLQAIVKDGVDVRGYFVWSLLDVFELLTGYQSRFGLYYVDFNDDDRRRRAKLSATWYSGFLKGKKKHQAGSFLAQL